MEHKKSCKFAYAKKAKMEATVRLLEETIPSIQEGDTRFLLDAAELII